MKLKPEFMSELNITPKTKVYDLLEVFPELEDALIEMVPAFKKLKNPVLRRTITRVTTLQQAAKVGGVNVETLINNLREMAGQDRMKGISEDEMPEEKPDWFDAANIVKKINATPLINAGKNPLEIVLRETRDYDTDEILELVTPFYPAPLIDTMGKQGFKCWAMKIDEEEYRTFITK